MAEFLQQLESGRITYTHVQLVESTVHLKFSEWYYLLCDNSDLSTCFSQCEAYIITDIRDCTPHISLFLSFKRSATAVQIPG